MTHNPKPTDAQMKLARECAAKACGEPQRVAILDGQFDRTPGVKSALLAIQATEARMALTALKIAGEAVEAERERMLAIVEKQAGAAKQERLAKGRCYDPDDMIEILAEERGERIACQIIAAAIRSHSNG